LRILITGGTGFVGAHLIRLLQSRASQISVLASGKHPGREPGVQCHELDIRDREKVRSVVREVNPEQIYHLAGITAVGASWSDPRLTYEINVFGAQNLFDAAMNLPVPPRILNVSTSQVYAPAAGSLTEESPLAPDNPYAASKAMAELLIPQYSGRAAGGIITARPFNHTGSGQPPNFVLPSIAKQFAEIELGLRPAKLSLGNTAVGRDFTDVRDVVLAYRALLEKGRTSQVYNVCSGTTVLLSDVVKIFETISRISVTIEIDRAKVRPQEVAEIRGDSNKLQTETGWRPQIPLEKTVEDMMDFWRSQCRVAAQT
jgi:GDP-4-dehydro-6-deoxy-D-mannose reductase